MKTSTYTNANAGALVIGTPVYISAATSVDKARSNAATTAPAIGLVVSNTAAASTKVSVCTTGILKTSTANWDTVTGQTGGLTAGARYYVSSATAGQLTTTAPTAAGTYTTQVGIAQSATEMCVDCRPPALLNSAASVDGLTGYAMQCATATFTETTGAGVYTGTIALPAGASLFDVVIDGVSLWTATTSATMNVGDAGSSTGFYNGINLKATDLLAGESISFDEAGGKAGGYIANSQVSPRYSATARTVIGVITTVGAAGNAGVTRMTVIWAAPTSTFITAATKV